MSKRKVACCREVRRGLRYALCLLMALACSCGLPLTAQKTHGPKESQKERRIVIRVEPEYPAPLKRLYIGGMVRVEVVVAPNGTVQSTELLGGSPFLGQAAMKAIKEWRYAPATSSETLIVIIEFDPYR